MSTVARDGALDAPGPHGPRARASAGVFLWLVATLAGPSAPMGIATALAGALTLACLAPAPRPAWPRTPLQPAAVALLAHVSLMAGRGLVGLACAARLWPESAA